MTRKPHSGPATRHGNGSGLYGPAKGAGIGGAKRPAFEPGNKAAAGADHSDVEQTRQAKAAKAETLKNHLYTLATTAEREDTQVRAAEAWLNREEGMPVARNITVATDDLSQLDDDALARRQAELEARLRSDT